MLFDLLGDIKDLETMNTLLWALNVLVTAYMYKLCIFDETHSRLLKVVSIGFLIYSTFMISKYLDYESVLQRLDEFKAQECFVNAPFMNEAINGLI